MDQEYWHEKWQTADIGFHEAEGNSLLPDYFTDLSLPAGGRLFVPLCGKTRDIGWLLSQGYRVVGVELSELAVRQLFAEMEVEPTIVIKDGMKCYSVTDLDIFVGDFFQLTRELLGPVDAVFDRAALVALPEEMRIRYAGFITGITGKAPQLLITFEYDQTQMAGPPFSISAVEMPEHYRDCYLVSQLASVDVAGKLKGKCVAKENVWLLMPPA